MLSIFNLNRLMSLSSCSHINIQTIDVGVVAIELLPTQNSLGVRCILHMQRVWFDSRWGSRHTSCMALLLRKRILFALYS